MNMYCQLSLHLTYTFLFKEKWGNVLGEWENWGNVLFELGSERAMGGFGGFEFEGLLFRMLQYCSCAALTQGWVGDPP